MPINMNGGAQGDRVPPPWERLENSPYVGLLSNQDINGGEGLPNFPYQGFQALMNNPASQLTNPGMPGIARLLEALLNSQDNGGGTVGGGGPTGAGGGAGGGVGVPQDTTGQP